MESLNIIYSFLNSRKQRVKINSEYSSLEEIIFGVSQGSILGDFFIIDIFLMLNDIKIASYADDNTPCCSYNSFEDVISCLQRTMDGLFRSFSDSE